MKEGDHEMLGSATDPSEAFDREEFHRQWETQRQQYFAEMEQQQQLLGGLVLEKIAEKPSTPEDPRNIVQEVADEAPCSVRDAQLAFWTVQSRGEMTRANGMFVPTDKGREVLRNRRQGSNKA
jgi:hypothetical protein